MLETGSQPISKNQHLPENPMKEHFVRADVDDQNRIFTLTARKLSAKLLEVDNQTKAGGYRKVEIASRLTKQQAEAMKKALRAVYEAALYTYQERKPLS